MAVTTILAFDDQKMVQMTSDYIKEYDLEISKTPALDLTGLGTPKVASTETLEEVLDLMGQSSGGVALIYAHANSDGLIMRITDKANSALSKNIRGISRAWRAIFEMIQLRSGKWPAQGKPEFLVDVPGALALFKGLLVDLRKFGGNLADRLADPSTVTNREQADAWFDQWMDLMGKATLGGGLGETELRRVCRAMQKVREARFDRVEFRSCNIGSDKESLNAFKEFFGTGVVVAPTTTMFRGQGAVNITPGGDLEALARGIGGFRGTHFTAPRSRGSHYNRMPNAEPELATGHRNRIFPERGPVEVIMQVTEVEPFHFSVRIFATSPAAMTRFVQSKYKAGATFQASTKLLPVGGMWTPSDPKSLVPFLVPLDSNYRDFLETST
jgi:hypothetical protein